ncbi:MAG: helix-turn-helix domain-containing protein [bacterium]
MKTIEPTTQTPAPEYLRVPQAAARFGVCDATLRDWIKRRIIPAFAPTRRTLLIKAIDVDKALARFRVGGVA